MKRLIVLFSFSRQRFIDLCEGKVDRGLITMMKDISLAKTNAKGEYLYNKVQDIVWDEVMSKYILLPEVCSCFIVFKLVQIFFLIFLIDFL